MVNHGMPRPYLKQTEYYGTGLNGWSVASIRGYHSLIMVGS